MKPTPLENLVNSKRIFPSQPSIYGPDLKKVESPLQISVSPRQVFRILFTISVLLTIVSTLMITALYFYRWPEGSPMFNLVKIFWLDAEANVPTLYQSLTLILSGCLLMTISFIAARAKENYVFHWKLMSIIFLYLGFDEGAHIHEVVLELFKQSLQGSLWVQNHISIKLLFFLPEILAVTIFALIYLPFLIYLPRRTRWLFILSGAIYVGGALFMDMAGQYFAHTHGKGNPIYGGLATIEEFMEMFGISIFIYALLNYLSRKSPKFRILFKDPNDPE